MIDLRMTLRVINLISGLLKWGDFTTAKLAYPHVFVHNNYSYDKVPLATVLNYYFHPKS